MGPEAQERLIPKDCYCVNGIVCFEYQGKNGITGFVEPRDPKHTLENLDPTKVNPKALDAVIELLNKYRRKT
ncbi:hypothetical protein D3C76_1822760 [compost metagenome]